MRKKLINKVAKKRFMKKCYFCEENKYELLDVHRIIPGDSGPGYIENNTVVLCCSCHRKVHAGLIIIDKKYYSTCGKYLLHYWRVEGDVKEEFWN